MPAKLEATPEKVITVERMARRQLAANDGERDQQGRSARQAAAEAAEMRIEIQKALTICGCAEIDDVLRA